MLFTFRVSPVLLLIGNNPDQLGPISKSTSGIADPFTQNSTTCIFPKQLIISVRRGKTYYLREALGFENVIFCTPLDALFTAP